MDRVDGFIKLSPQKGLARMDVQTVADAASVRKLIRSGGISGHTSGFAPGYTQGNVVILPQKFADDFRAFCKANPKSCPVLAESFPGDPTLPTLGAGIDIRHDLPRYRVFHHGALTSEATDVGALWRDDLVTFVIGCSFTFEAPLIAAGIPLRHVAQKRNVAMYRTNIPTTPVGPFSGPMVVSMRPLKPADALRAIEITNRFPDMHGGPVHFGFPEQIGITDLATPDYGDAVEIEDGEVPVFWACGVTPQTVIQNARPDFCITHSPGCMLITDLRHG